MQRRMRVFIGIGVGMVHTVHQCVGACAQVRGALRYKSEDKPELLPSFTHGKRTVGSISVLKKRLRKKG